MRVDLDFDKRHAEWVAITNEYIALMQDHARDITERTALLKQKEEELTKAFNALQARPVG